MRLIDGDALKTDLTRFYDNEVTAKRLIDEQPTIDAIPVEWLRDMMLEREAEESRAAWVVMREWRKWKREQEAHGT